MKGSTRIATPPITTGFLSLSASLIESMFVEKNSSGSESRVSFGPPSPNWCGNFASELVVVVVEWMVVAAVAAAAAAVATHLHRWPREAHAARRRHRRGQLEAQRAGDEQAEDQTSETHRKSQRRLAGQTRSRCRETWPVPVTN